MSEVLKIKKSVESVRLIKRNNWFLVQVDNGKTWMTVSEYKNITDAEEDFNSWYS